MGKGRRFFKWALGMALAAVVLSLALVTLLRWVPVRYTPVMLKRAFQFREVQGFQTEQEWVSLGEISPELIKAVIAAEDGRFFKHHGFDTDAVRAMWKAHRKDGTPIRGCSTISQQTAKNVFTFGTRFPLRKIPEAYWTVLIELIWGKFRILEVYLNVAEWGRGIYGAERASIEYFGIPAANLNPAQAAAMAVCLPRPLLERPGSLSPEGKRRSGKIARQISSIQLSYKIETLTHKQKANENQVSLASPPALFHRRSLDHLPPSQPPCPSERD